MKNPVVRLKCSGITCKRLFENARQAVQDLGMQADVVKVEVIAAIVGEASCFLRRLQSTGKYYRKGESLT